MPIDPKVREAFEQRGVDSVRALLKQTGTGRGAPVTLGPGFWANRSDGEEWPREKDGQREKREGWSRRLVIIGLIIAAVGVLFTYLTIPPRHVEPAPQLAPRHLIFPGTKFQPRGAGG